MKQEKINLNKNVSGVVISAVKRDSIAAKSGLNVGMVICKFHRKMSITLKKLKKYLIVFKRIQIQFFFRFMKENFQDF